MRVQQEAPQRMRGQPPGLQWERPQRMRGRLPERRLGRTLLQRTNDILLMRGRAEAEGQELRDPPLRLRRRLRTLYGLLDSDSSTSSTRGKTVCRKARGLTDRPWNGFMKMALLIWDGVFLARDASEHPAFDRHVQGGPVVLQPQQDKRLCLGRRSEERAWRPCRQPYPDGLSARSDASEASNCGRCRRRCTERSRSRPWCWTGDRLLRDPSNCRAAGVT